MEFGLNCHSKQRSRTTPAAVTICILDFTASHIQISLAASIVSGALFVLVATGPGRQLISKSRQGLEKLSRPLQNHLNKERAIHCQFIESYQAVHRGGVQV